MPASCGLTVYSFQNVAVVVDGKLVTGLWEGDDVVQVEPHSDIGTPMVGADGAAIVSITADRSVNITLKLQPTSPQHAFLHAKWRRMRSGLFVPFQISIRDTGTNEGGSSAEAVIVKAPTNSYGVNAQSRDWMLFAQCWEPTEVAYV